MAFNSEDYADDMYDNTQSYIVLNLYAFIALQYM